jgi:hypothetical protein
MPNKRPFVQTFPHLPTSPHHTVAAFSTTWHILYEPALNWKLHHDSYYENEIGDQVVTLSHEQDECVSRNHEDTSTVTSEE